MFLEIGVLKNLQYSQRNTCVSAWDLHLYKNEAPTQVFSNEYCEIFKNSLFYRTPPLAASEQKKKNLALAFIQDLRTPDWPLFSVHHIPWPFNLTAYESGSINGFLVESKTTGYEIEFLYLLQNICL